MITGVVLLLVAAIVFAYATARPRRGGYRPLNSGHVNRVPGTPPPLLAQTTSALTAGRRD